MFRKSFCFLLPSVTPRKFITDLRALVSPTSASSNESDLPQHSSVIVKLFQNSRIAVSNNSNDGTNIYKLQTSNNNSSDQQSNLEVPPPSLLQFASSKSNNNTVSNNNNVQPTVILVPPQRPLFSVSESCFIINSYHAHVLSSSPKETASQQQQQHELNETILHCVDVLATTIIHYNFGNQQQSGGNNSEMLIEIGETLVKAWNIVNESVNANNSQDQTNAQNKYLTTLRDYVFEKEKRALLTILASGRNLFPHSINNNNNNNNNTTSPMKTPMMRDNNITENNDNRIETICASQKFIADVIKNEELVNFHGRNKMKEALGITASTAMTFTDVSNIYRLVIDGSGNTFPSSVGPMFPHRHAKFLLFSMICDSWRNSQITMTMTGSSQSYDDGSSSNGQVVSANRLLISGKLIPHRAINIELIKFVSEFLGPNGCDTICSWSSHATLKQQQSTASSTSGAESSLKDAMTQQSSASASSTPTSMICAPPFIHDDIISSIATVGLEYFKVRYLPYILSPACSSKNNNNNNNNTTNPESNNNNSTASLKNKKTSSLSSSPSSNLPPAAATSTGNSSSSLNAKKLKQIESELGVAVKSSDINANASNNMDVATGDVFLVCMCILAGYSNNVLSALVNSTSANSNNSHNAEPVTQDATTLDDVLSYISRRTRQFFTRNPQSDGESTASSFPTSIIPKNQLALWLLGSPLVSASFQEEVLLRQHILPSQLDSDDNELKNKNNHHVDAAVPLHRVLHLLRSPAFHRNDSLFTSYVIGTLLPQSFVAGFNNVERARLNHQHAHSHLCHTSSFIARTFQPGNILNLGPAVSHLALLLTPAPTSPGAIPLVSILATLTQQFQRLEGNSTAAHHLIETGEEWLLVLRTCQVALREEFTNNIGNGRNNCQFQKVINDFCVSLIDCMMRVSGGNGVLLQNQEAANETKQEQQQQAHVNEPLIVEKLRSLILVHDVLKEIQFVDEVKNKNFVFMQHFVDQLSNHTGGDASNALHLLGVAIKWRNCGCLMSRETWTEISDFFLTTTSSSSSENNKNQNTRSNMSILDNIHERYDVLASFAEICSEVMRENSITVVSRITEKIFLSQQPSHQEQQNNDNNISEQQPDQSVGSWTPISVQSEQQRKLEHHHHQQQQLGMHQEQRHQRLLHFQLRAAPRVFRALTHFGEWNSRLVAPIVDLVLRTADPVVNSAIFVDIIGTAVNSRIDDSEVRKTSVEPLTTKCFASMLKDETVERYATDEVFTKLLRVVMLAATSRHSQHVNELTNRLSMNLPMNSLMELIKILRFDLHLEKGVKRLLAECSKRLSLSTTTALEGDTTTNTTTITSSSTQLDGNNGKTDFRIKNNSNTISFHQICSVNASCFVPTMVKWNSMMIYNRAVLSIGDESEGDAGKSLSKVIRTGDLFASPQQQQQQQQRIFTSSRGSNRDNLDLSLTSGLLRKFDADGTPIDQDLMDQFLRIVIHRAESPSFGVRRVLTLLNNLMFCHNSVPLEALLAIYRPLISVNDSRLRLNDKQSFGTQIISSWCSMVRLRIIQTFILSPPQENINNDNHNNNLAKIKKRTKYLHDRLKGGTLELLESFCPFMMLGDGTGSTTKAAEEVSFAISNLLHILSVIDVVVSLSCDSNKNDTNLAKRTEVMCKLTSLFPSTGTNNQNNGTPASSSSYDNYVNPNNTDLVTLFDFDFDRYHHLIANTAQSAHDCSNNLSLSYSFSPFLHVPSSPSDNANKDNNSNNKILQSQRTQLLHAKTVLNKWIPKLCGSAVERFKTEQVMRSRHVALRTAIDESSFHALNQNTTTANESKTSENSFISSPWSSWLHDPEVTTSAILNNSQHFYVKYLEDFAQMKRLTVAARWLNTSCSDLEGENEEGRENIKKFVETFLG